MQRAKAIVTWAAFMILLSIVVVYMIFVKEVGSRGSYI